METFDAAQIPSPLKPVYSIVDPEEIRVLIDSTYSVGQIVDCALLQRGFNDVYEVSFSDGRRGVARLSSRRERGVPNVMYETALLRHLRTAGAAVAEPWAARDGSLFVNSLAPEGERALVIFDYLPGKCPDDDLADIAVMGAELANIHNLSRNYAGPASAYTLDMDHLLRRPLARILSLPVFDADARDFLTSVATEIESRFAGFDDLKIVACHGDCHGGNTIMTQGKNGGRVASFFDFDDGGPGFQAYDLSVYLWGGLLGKRLAKPDSELQSEWNAFIGGYLEASTISDVDFHAIPVFLTIRHFWLMGEYASRVQRMGLRTFRAPWFLKRFMLAKEWQSLRIARP